MEFRILGPLEAIDDGTKLSLGGPRQRLVLAYLLLEANRVVPTDRLIDRIWGDEPPEAARSALFAYISRLKKLLGTGRIQARPPGYVLTADPAEVDALRFAAMVADAKSRPDPASVAAGLTDALALWRGEPLADLADEEALQPALARLDEQRLAAEEERAEALLTAGDHRRAVPLLEKLVADHGLRERPRMQLMLGLYRSGRQNEALAEFHKVRQLLASELGIDPSPELRQLHEQILRHDGALALRDARTQPATGAAPPAPSTGRDRRTLVAGATASVAIVVLALVFVLIKVNPGPGPARPDAVLRVESDTGKITAVTTVGRKPAALSYDGTNVWVANFDDRTIQAIDPVTAEAQPAIGGFSGHPIGLVAGAGSLWVALAFPVGEVVRVDLAAHNTIVPAIEKQDGLEAVAFGEGYVWATNSVQNRLVRLDPVNDGRQQLELEGSGASGIAISAGAVWVAEPLLGAIVGVDPATMSVTRTVQVVAGEPAELVYGEGYVWSTNTSANSLTRIDPAPNGLAQTIEEVGNGPTGIATGAGRVWVANTLGRTVAWIDAKNGRLVGSFELPAASRPSAVLVADGAIWIAVQAG